MKYSVTEFLGATLLTLMNTIELTQQMYQNGVPTMTPKPGQQQVMFAPHPAYMNSQNVSMSAMPPVIYNTSATVMNPQMPLLNPPAPFINANTPLQSNMIVTPQQAYQQGFSPTVMQPTAPVYLPSSTSSYLPGGAPGVTPTNASVFAPIGTVTSVNGTMYPNNSTQYFPPAVLPQQFVQTVPIMGQPTFQRF